MQEPAEIRKEELQRFKAQKQQDIQIFKQKLQDYMANEELY